MQHCRVPPACLRLCPCDRHTPVSLLKNDWVAVLVSQRKLLPVKRNLLPVKHRSPPLPPPPPLFRAQLFLGSSSLMMQRTLRLHRAR